MENQNSEPSLDKFLCSIEWCMSCGKENCLCLRYTHKSDLNSTNKEIELTEPLNLSNLNTKISEFLCNNLSKESNLRIVQVRNQSFEIKTFNGSWYLKHLM